MKPQLTSEEIKSILSMNDYWEEVSKRDTDVTGILNTELRSLTQFIGAKNILSIIGEYAKNHKE